MVDLEFLRQNKRKWTASKLAMRMDYGYAEILTALEEMNVHGNWTEEDFQDGRPVFYDELEELVTERLEEMD